MSEYENRKCIIGKRIKDERERKGWGKKEFLKQIFMAESSTKTLSAWEKGERIPDLDSLDRMAKVFQCDIGYLLGDYDTRRHENADIHREIGLAEETIFTLRGFKQLHITNVAKTVDFLIADKKFKNHLHRSILDLLYFFLSYSPDACTSKIALSDGSILDSLGAIPVGLEAIRLDGRIIENAILMELEQALLSLKKTVHIRKEDTNG